MSQGHMSKKELKEDKLLEFFTKLGHFVRVNKNIIKRSIVAFLLLVAVIVGLAMRSSAQENEATLLFEEGYSLLRQPDFKKNISTIDKKLKEVISSYPSTYAALKAKFYLANLNFELQDFTSAKKQFEAVVDGGNSTYIYPASLLSLGAIAERGSDFKNAIKFYDKIIADPSWNGFHGIALLRKAGGLIKLNKSKDAFEVLKKLQGMQSYYASEATKLISYFMVSSANNPKAKQAPVATKKLNIK